MKFSRILRKLFRKRIASPASSPGATNAQEKSAWNCRFEAPAVPGGTLGYLDGLDERGRLVGWIETPSGMANRIIFRVEDAQVVVRAELQRNDVIAAGYAGGRGFMVEVIALAPLVEQLLKGSPLRILDARNESLCEPLLWKRLKPDERTRVLYAWLTECFRASIEDESKDREIRTEFSRVLSQQPEIVDSGNGHPEILGTSLKGMQDLCGENFGGDSGFADNVRALRDLCVQLGEVNPRWENAAAGFEVALLLEKFLVFLRQEWRDKSMLNPSAWSDAPFTPETEAEGLGCFMAPPLYPDRFHYLPWDGWVRKALDGALLLATNLARSEALSAELVERAKAIGSAAALLYRDDQIIVGAQRLVRACGTVGQGQIEIEARALKRLGRFTEAFSLERGHGIDRHESTDALTACFTTALGVALEIHQPLSLLEIRAWRQRMAPVISDAASDQLLQKTLSDYLSFCGRALMNPRLFGVISLKNVLALRSDLIQSIRELLHLLSPHREHHSTAHVSAYGARVLVVGSSDLPQVRLYRQIQKVEALQKLLPDVDGLEVVHVDSWQQIDSPKLTQLLAGTALLVLCRLPATLPFLRLVHAARGAGIPVLYDIDDLLFDAENFPPPYATYAGGISRRAHQQLAEDTVLWLEAMRSADSVVVSTTTLAGRARDLLEGCMPIIIEPNHAPRPLLDQAAIRSSGTLSFGSNVHIVYGTGTLAHKQILLDWIFPVLRELVEQYEELEISLVGRLEDVPAELSSHERVRVIPFGAYEEYLSILASADISLAPLESGIATDAKSALKWMEAAMLGAACVVSPSATYREILEPDLDVLFAENRNEWKSQVARLIEGDQFRKRIAKAANSKARRLSGPSHARDFWRSRLEEVPAFSKERRTAPRTRLLVVNLYFWPQAAGGATRVVEDQVGGLLRQYPGQYDITVLCADKFSGDLGVDFSVWRESVRVVRFHGASKAWSAWLDQEVEEFMRSWLRGESFDLVHVHAIQVLTPSLLKPVREAGIPYFVTLHDAWWLCEHQFLTKAYGNAVDPADWMTDLALPGGALGAANVGEDPELRVALEECLGALYENSKAASLANQAARMGMGLTSRKHPSLENLANERRALDKTLGTLVAEQKVRIELYSSFVRRRELAEYLGGASGVFAVSRTFADLYALALENSPIQPPSIHVLPNDWQSYPSYGPQRSDGPLRCAFIGGWSVHKGAAVVREAMARLRAKNIELTIVDYGLGKGETRRTMWGGMEVCFVGPRALDEMANFYASIDVLLAPSIWPESFGLVSREALSAGLWVIGTDVGALSEPIEQGVNGAVIPARDPQALADAIDFAASPEGTVARAGWRAQAGIWLEELPKTDNLATLHARYGEFRHV